MTAPLAPVSPAAYEPLARPAADTPIPVVRWPTELPLFGVAAAVSAVLWLLAIVSGIGLIYAVVLGAFFFAAHVGFVAQVRGSAVRLGPEQFPELHERVTRLAQRMGLDPVPEAYVMQAGGALNAFATRFLRANIVVLYSDLLAACGDSEAARDMIVAHELGHIRAGHLRWRWPLLPASVVPFLGPALSRARELTCDRIGLAGAGDRGGATLGLAILAAGPSHGPRVNRAALVRQADDLNTGWMTLGTWLASHPPLAHRLAQLDPALAAGRRGGMAGPLRAVAILAAIALVMGGTTAVFVAKLLPLTRAAAGAQGAVSAADQQLAGQAVRDMAELSALVDAERAAGHAPPTDVVLLYRLWASLHPGQSAAGPRDPFDGRMYGYERRGDGWVLWSVGPDRRTRTPDDVVFDPRQAAR